MYTVLYATYELRSDELKNVYLNHLGVMLGTRQVNIYNAKVKITSALLVPAPAYCRYLLDTAVVIVRYGVGAAAPSSPCHTSWAPGTAALSPPWSCCFMMSTE